MVKKLSLFVSIALGFTFSIALMPSVVLDLYRASELSTSQIWEVIVFLFSFPIIVTALVVAIMSLRKRTLERFAIWLNFSGTMTICVYKIFQYFSLFEMLQYVNTPDAIFVVLLEFFAPMTPVVAAMILACAPLFIKQTETY